VADRAIRHPEASELVNHLTALSIIQERYPDATLEELAMWVFLDRLAVFDSEPVWKSEKTRPSRSVDREPIRPPVPPSGYELAQIPGTALANAPPGTSPDRLLRELKFIRADVEAFQPARAARDGEVSKEEDEGPPVNPSGRYLTFGQVLERLAQQPDFDEDRAREFIEDYIDTEELHPLHYVVGLINLEDRLNPVPLESALFMRDQVERLMDNEFPLATEAEPKTRTEERNRALQRAADEIAKTYDEQGRPYKKKTIAYILAEDPQFKMKQVTIERIIRLPNPRK